MLSYYKRLRYIIYILIVLDIVLYAFALVVSFYHLSAFFRLFESKLTKYYFKIDFGLLASLIAVAIEVSVFYMTYFYNYLGVEKQGKYFVKEVRLKGYNWYKFLVFMLWFGNYVIMYRNFRANFVSLNSLFNTNWSFLDKVFVKEFLLILIGFLASFTILALNVGLATVLSNLFYNLKKVNESIEEISKKEIKEVGEKKEVSLQDFLGFVKDKYNVEIPFSAFWDFIMKHKKKEKRKKNNLYEKVEGK